MNSGKYKKDGEFGKKRFSKNKDGNKKVKKEEKKYTGPGMDKNGKEIDPSKTATVFVGQLPFDSSEDMLRNYFVEHDIEVRDIRFLREKETNKFRGIAYVDLPQGSIWKAIDLHKTFFNGRMINVEETVSGGKHSEGRKDFNKRMRQLHDERFIEQNKLFVASFLEKGKAKFKWDDFDNRCREAVYTFPQDDVKIILERLMKSNFSKVKNRDAYLMGIIRNRRRELEKKD